MEKIKTYIKRNIRLQEGLLDRVKNKEVIHEELVKEFLEENYNITGDYTIDTTKTPYVVNLSGHARLKNNAKQLVNDLFVFGEVTGSFSCSLNIYIKSLKGAPEKVGFDFYCTECKSLMTLEGAPKEVGDSFGCCDCNNLIDLKGAPEKVGRNFKCTSCNSLKTLEGAPKEVGGMFSCRSCLELETLKGAPKEVGGNFYCDYCIKLTSFKYGPKIVKGFYSCQFCNDNLTYKDVQKTCNIKRTDIYI